MNDISILDNGDSRVSMLAEKTGAPVIAEPSADGGLFLFYDGDVLTLSDGSLSLTGDFSRLEKRISPKNLSGEMLVKAARIKDRKDVTLLDATAGLGEDSFLLAASGIEVHLFEYDKIIFALLEDAHRRALEIPALRPAASRMHLHCENSIEAMKSGAVSADVIFLDPMFPERQKSALIKKKFQLLQKLESPCENGEELFYAALSSSPKRIIVKRPQKGKTLTDRKPSYSLNGSAVRYDCYLCPTT